MVDEPEETPTSWKQWRVKTNLGTLASIAIAISVLVWQGMMIRSQIDDNSNAVTDMAYAVEELAGAVSLANELDTRTNILFGEIDSLRDQYQEQADVWIEISTQSEQIDTIRTEARILRTDIESTWNQQNEFRMEVTERVGEFDSARTDLSDLQWQVDDLNRRVAEAWGVAIAGDDEDYGWQITDLTTRLAELTGRVNASSDLDWQIDDLSRRVTELQVRMDTGGSGIEQWQIDDLWNAHNDVYGRTEGLYGVTDEMWDLLWRMWTALETQDWSHEHLYR